MFLKLNEAKSSVKFRLRVDDVTFYGEDINGLTSVFCGSDQFPVSQTVEEIDKQIEKLNRMVLPTSDKEK